MGKHSIPKPVPPPEDGSSKHKKKKGALAKPPNPKVAHRRLKSVALPSRIDPESPPAAARVLIPETFTPPKLVRTPVRSPPAREPSSGDTEIEEDDETLLPLPFETQSPFDPCVVVCDALGTFGVVRCPDELFATECVSFVNIYGVATNTPVCETMSAHEEDVIKDTKVFMSMMMAHMGVTSYCGIRFCGNTTPERRGIVRAVICMEEDFET